MKIDQNKDGSIDITFSDDDLKAIKKNNNTFHIDTLTLKHSINIIVKFCAKIIEKLPKKIKNMMSDDNNPVWGREKK